MSRHHWAWVRVREVKPWRRWSWRWGEEGIIVESTIQRKPIKKKKKGKKGNLEESMNPGCIGYTTQLGISSQVIVHS